MHRVLIFTPKITPRIQYIFDFILQEFSGISYELTNNIQFFEVSEKIKINYSSNKIPNSFFLKSDDFMFESGSLKEVDFSKLSDIGKCFYALSRYEEYLIKDKDQHQRISGKGRVYKTPFVDSFILHLQNALKREFSELKFKSRKFSIHMSCDVDQAWKYKHKGLKRRLGANIKDLLKFNLKEISKREAVISGSIKDPFDTYYFFENLHHSGKIDKTIFFWLVGNYGKFDKNTPVNNHFFQMKVREISKWAECGLHPSYTSNTDINQLKKEKNTLEKIVENLISKSRQHYLKLNLPKTYQNLISIGITEDYSMAYADETGFRAGTCTPFYWYNLQNEEKTNLKVHSFCAMDVSLRNYMKLTPNEAINELRRLKKEVEKVQGNMTLLFHNSNLNDEWEEWKEVIKEIIN